MSVMAQRAGIAQATLSKIERGDPQTSMGGYASVLFVLGMIDRLEDLMASTHDSLGLELEEERLPQRVRRTSLGSSQ